MTDWTPASLPRLVYLADAEHGEAVIDRGRVVGWRDLPLRWTEEHLDTLRWEDDGGAPRQS